MGLPHNLSGIEKGWIYVCDDGSFCRQVVVQKLRSGKIRLLCENTGGQAEAVANKMLEQVQKMVDEGKVNWSEVDVENVES